MPNRFFKLRPVTFDGIEMYTPNFELLNSVLASQQDTYNKRLTATDQLRDLIPKGGFATKDIVSQLSSEFNQGIDEITDQLTTTGNIAGGDRAIVNLARNLKRDPRYIDATKDEAYMENVMKLTSHEEFPDAMQDFYDPSAGGYTQLKNATGQFDPAAHYRTIFPVDWNKGYMDTGLATIRDNLTSIEPDAVEGGLRSVPTYDVDGNLIGSKLYIEMKSGVRKELTEDRVRSLLNGPLGRNMFESQIQGRNFRQAQFEKVNDKNYEYDNFVDDVINSMKGQFYSVEDIRYSEKLHSEMKQGKTKEGDDVGESINGMRPVGSMIGQADVTGTGADTPPKTLKSEAVIKIDEDGNIDLLTDKLDIYNNTEKRIEEFHVDDDMGLFKRMEMTGALGKDALGVIFEGMSKEIDIPNYFTDMNELGYVPSITSYLADNPAIEQMAISKMRGPSGEELAPGEAQIKLHEAASILDREVATYNELALVHNRIADAAQTYAEEHGIIASAIKAKEDIINNKVVIPYGSNAKTGFLDPVKARRDLEDIKQNGIKAESMKTIREGIIKNLPDSVFPQDQAPTEYYVNTFLPGDITGRDFKNLSVTDLSKFSRAGQLEWNQAAGMMPEINSDGKVIAPGREIGFYQITPVVDDRLVRGEGWTGDLLFTDIKMQAGVPLTKNDMEKVIGARPVGFVSLSDGRKVQVGKVIFKKGDGYIESPNNFLLDNGTNDFNREISKFIGDSNPVHLGKIIDNTIGLMELAGHVERRMVTMRDNSLIPGAELTVKKGLDTKGNQFEAKLKYRDGNGVTLTGKSAYDLANQLLPYVKAGNSGTYSNKMDWSPGNVIDFNPKNDYTLFDNTIINYNSVSSPILNSDFYSEYSKVDKILPVKAQAVSMLRSIELNNQLGSPVDDGHGVGKAIDLEDSPILTRFFNELTGGDITKGYQNIPGTNLRVWRHRDDSGNGFHFDIRMQ